MAVVVVYCRKWPLVAVSFTATRLLNGAISERLWKSFDLIEVCSIVLNMVVIGSKSLLKAELFWFASIKMLGWFALPPWMPKHDLIAPWRVSPR